MATRSPTSLRAGVSRPPTTNNKRLEAEKARLLDQLAAAFDRDMAEGQRLAALYPDIFVILPLQPASEPRFG